MRLERHLKLTAAKLTSLNYDHYRKITNSTNLTHNTVVFHLKSLSLTISIGKGGQLPNQGLDC